MPEMQEVDSVSIDVRKVVYDTLKTLSDHVSCIWKGDLGSRETNPVALYWMRIIGLGFELSDEGDYNEKVGLFFTNCL
jgi:hypothetical protein